MRPIDLTNPVDWQCPLNYGLLSWWLPLPGRAGSNTLFDIARTNHGTLTNGPTWTAGRDGFGAVQFDGSNDYVNCGSPTGLNGATAATISALVYRSSTGTTVGLGGCGGSSSGGDNRFSFVWWTDGNLYFSAAQTGFSGYSYAAVSGTGWRHVTLVYDGSQAGSSTRAKLYVDGVQQSVTYVSGVGTALGNVNPFWLGADASDRVTGGTVGSTSLYLRALSDAEVAGLYGQILQGYPDQLRRVSTRTWFVGSIVSTAYLQLETGGNDNLQLETGDNLLLEYAASTTAYSLAASAASFAITGTAANLLRGRRIAADSASYAITGTAAGVLRGRRVGADSASYAITGANANFPRNRVVAASAASYAITGTAANLARSRIVGADAAPYAITGTAAGLLRGRRVGADAASYAVTGSNAALLYGRRLLAASASYVITGTDANLVKSGGYTLNADPASLAVTGTAAGVLRGRRIASDSASYVLTGANANLLRGRRVAADSAAYVITGANADFPRTRVLTATAGSHVITGTAATLARSRIMPAAAGSYAITGTATNLLRGRRVGADSASYAITGTAATLRIARRLSASSAAYAITGSEVTLIYSGDPGGGFGAHLSKIPLRG